MNCVLRVNFQRKNRGDKPAPSGTEGKRPPEVDPGQLPRTRPALSVGNLFWSWDLAYASGPNQK